MPESAIEIARQEIRDQQQFFRELRAQLERDAAVVLFLGGGLSREVGLSDWTGFLRLQAQRKKPIAGEKSLVATIDDLISEGRFPEAASILERELKDKSLQEAVAREFGDQHLEGKTATDTLRLLPYLGDRPVLTTNFDSILERVFERSGKPFVGFGIGADVREATKAIFGERALGKKGAHHYSLNTRRLIKIHGNASSPANRVLTASEYHSVRERAQTARP